MSAPLVASSGAPRPKGRADVLVVVDAESLADGPHADTIRETRDGAELAFATVERMCCDALIRRVVLDAAGNVIDVGRSSRTATETQWATLNAMYTTCGWARCDHPVSWCQAHHIHEWEHGGLTDLDNLVPLCSQHQHAVHEGGYTIKLLHHRTLRVFRPDGTLHAVTNPDRLDDRPRPRGSTPPPRNNKRRLVHN